MTMKAKIIFGSFFYFSLSYFSVFSAPLPLSLLQAEGATKRLVQQFFRVENFVRGGVNSSMVSCFSTLTPERVDQGRAEFIEKSFLQQLNKNKVSKFSALELLQCRTISGANTHFEEKQEKKNPFGLREYPLLRCYLGEDVAAPHPVRYLNHEERKLFEITCKGGGLVDAHCLPVSTPAFGANIVLSLEGKIYLSRVAINGIFHHSSFTAGSPLAFAGRATVADGIITKLTNASGHYRPPVCSIGDFINYLATKGVCIDTSAIMGMDADLFFDGDDNGELRNAM